MRVLNGRALRLRVTAVVLALAALEVGCAVPAGHPALEQADAAVERARRSPRVRALAAAELDRAEVALQDAREAARAGASPDQVEHLVYVVNQRAALAEARAAQQVARSEIERLEGALDHVLVQGRLEPGRQARSSFSARDGQPRSPLQDHAGASSAEDAQAQTLLQHPGQAHASARETQHAQAPLQGPQQVQRPVEQPEKVHGPLKAREVRASVAIQQAAAAEPDPVSADVEALSQEIKLSLAQLSFTGAEPTSETGARLEAVAEQLLREPERSVSIEAEFNLPDPEGRTTLEQRVEIVRAILLRRGVAPARVVVRASGGGPAEPQVPPSFMAAPY